MQSEAGAANCEKFVEVLGLKTFFPAFMGKVSLLCPISVKQNNAKIQGEGKKKKLGATSSFEDEEHLLGILVSLFTNLESDTPPRIRLLAKFVENEYEKVERLLEMREAAEGKLRSVDRDIASERQVRTSAASNDKQD
jgi:beta-catenin-like protein 1